MPRSFQEFQILRWRHTPYRADTVVGMSCECYYGRHCSPAAHCCHSCLTHALARAAGLDKWCSTAVYAEWLIDNSNMTYGYVPTCERTIKHFRSLGLHNKHIQQSNWHCPTFIIHTVHRHKRNNHLISFQSLFKGPQLSSVTSLQLVNLLLWNTSQSLQFHICVLFDSL